MRSGVLTREVGRRLLTREVGKRLLTREEVGGNINPGGGRREHQPRRDGRRDINPGETAGETLTQEVSTRLCTQEVSTRLCTQGRAGGMLYPGKSRRDAVPRCGNRAMYPGVVTGLCTQAGRRYPGQAGRRYQGRQEVPRVYREGCI